MPDANTSPTRKKSLKNYATKVFSESSVGAVSAIVSTRSLPSKVFRVLVFLIFTAGFLYQCIKFLTYVLEYPTVVNLEILKPKSYLTPAFTYCNTDITIRSKFCAKYPNSCVTPDESVCLKHPFYCGPNETLVIKEEDLLVHIKNKEELFELYPVVEDFVTIQNRQGEVDPPKIPMLRAKATYNVGLYTFDPSEHLVCYSVHERVDSDLDSDVTYTDYKKWLPSQDFLFIFDPFEVESVRPNVHPGVLFSVHSPFVAVNPATDGIFLSPGKTYRIKISMQEERLLPPPYKTDCVNYTEIWAKNNRSGPRSQEMCREKCYSDILAHHLNCSIVVFLYPSKIRSCTEDDLDNIKGGHEMINMMENCFSKCKDDCLKIKFTYQVQERYTTVQESDSNDLKTSRRIYVHVDIDDAEILSLCYRPQFQEVEAFSYIGGFIGIWLGVSLVQVADIFEALFRISRYYVRKGTSVCFCKKLNNLDP